MDRVGNAARSYGNTGAGRTGQRQSARAYKDEMVLKGKETKEESSIWQEAERKSDGEKEDGRRTDGKKESKTKGGPSKEEILQQQAAAQKSVQEWLERRQQKKQEEARGYGLVSQLQAQADSIRKAFDPKNKKNLYDATLDLTLLEQIEKVPSLRAMQSRLAFKIRAIKSSGARASEIRIAINKVKKVIGKVRGKIKGLEKEEVLERRRKRAEEAKRKTKEEALRREKEMRKKLRKARERKDIEESKMGLGANYGGPSEDSALEYVMDAYGGSISAEVGSVVDVAVSADTAAADAGAAAADVGGAVDVGL